MKKSLLGLAMLPFLAAPSMAASPLTDQQMDRVIAGFDFAELDVTNTGAALVLVNFPAIPVPTCSTCYLHVAGTTYSFDSGASVQSLQVLGHFGPGL